MDRTPISKELFLKHFWPVYDTLARLADGDAGKPAYFRFLTLLGVFLPPLSVADSLLRSYHCFLKTQAAAVTRRAASVPG